jgi:hypothetical protein
MTIPVLSPLLIVIANTATEHMLYIQCFSLLKHIREASRFLPKRKMLINQEH